MRAVLDRPKSFKKVVTVSMPNASQQVWVPQVYGDDQVSLVYNSSCVTLKNPPFSMNLSADSNFAAFRQ